VLELVSLVIKSRPRRFAEHKDDNLALYDDGHQQSKADGMMQEDSISTWRG